MIHHSSSYMPQLEINNTRTVFVSFLHCITGFFDWCLRFAYLTNLEFQDIFHNDGGLSSVLSWQIALNKNGQQRNGHILGVLQDQLFIVKLNNGSTMSVVHNALEFSPSRPANRRPLPAESLKQLQEHVLADPATCPRAHSPIMICSASFSVGTHALVTCL